jgi:GT2 family glycosyltransferase
MSPDSLTISVVVLSYNRPDHLRAALDSLLSQVCLPTEIIVVDNRSPNSSAVKRVVEQYTSVKLIQSPINLGYAGGMNLGIRKATGYYTYLTEDDIVLDNDGIRQLVDYMEEHPATVVASPIMYNKAQGTIRCAGGEVTLGGIYRRLTYNETNRHAGEFSQPFDVSYLDGASMFARTDFLHSTGGFREEFFMYVEAVEFCVRVAKTGRKLTVVPAAKVYHFEPPASANDSAEFDFHKYKNLFALYLLHAHARYLPEFFARYVLLGGLRALLGRDGNILMMLRALVWTLKRIPSLLKERRNHRLSPQVIGQLAPESQRPTLTPNEHDAFVSTNR